MILMLDDKQLKTLIKLYYLEHISQKNIAQFIGCHKNTINNHLKHIKFYLPLDIKEYLLCNKDTLLSSSYAFEQYYNTSVKPILDKSFKRSKRVLTEDVINSIRDLSVILSTTRPMVISDYIDEHSEEYPLLAELSYSSIRRALKN